MRWCIVSLLALAVALPAGAQQWQVARDQFAFAGRQLTIHVDTEMEGTLRVMRGPAGSVRILSRSDLGMTGAGLSADEQLTLTALGAGPVEYMVAVPQGVWINIRLPDSGLRTMGSRERSGMFHWTDAALMPEATTTAWLPVPDGLTGPAGTYTVLVGDLAPETVSLPDLVNIRSVTVRVEGDRFRVGASRPLALQQGHPRHLEIRPAGPPMDLILIVPSETASFSLHVRDGVALRLAAGDMMVLCSPSTRQWLSGGRAWVTFTPTAGELRCAEPAPPRHRG